MIKKKCLYSLETSSSGITPSGNINITTTQVTNVRQYATAQVVDTNLIASNIKKDVTILGVQGTYEGGGGSTNKLAQVVDDTITELTAKDLQGATKIKNSLFLRNSSLTSITIPSSVTSIGVEAFNSCSSLTSVAFASGSQLTSIGSQAFYECTSLTSITIPSSVTSIGSRVFMNCNNLTSIVIPSGVTSIGEYTFNSCSSLTSVAFASGSQLTSIGSAAFGGCKGITSIEIPTSVTSISTYAFYNCTSLTSITILATTPPTLSNVNAFTGTNDCPIYVPAESVATYKAATNWSTYATRIQAIQG